MTNAQRKDLESVKYFIPPASKGVEITSEDEKMFFDWSERGLHKAEIDGRKGDGFNALVQGKEWRGVHVGMYEEGVLDGSMPYIAIFENTPRSVVEFMAKEMFQGIDKEIILNLKFI